MKKCIFSALAFVMTFAILVPIMGVPAMATRDVEVSADYFNGFVTEIDEESFCSWNGQPTISTEGTHYIAFGYVVAGKDGWFLRYTEDRRSYVVVLVKTRSGYRSIEFDITGKGDYWIGEGSGPNAVLEVRFGRFSFAPEPH